jgi:hypothetical protein
MKERVQGRLGKGLAKNLKAFLATSHPGQPVMDKRDAQAGELPGYEA